MSSCSQTEEGSKATFRDDFTEVTGGRIWYGIAGENKPGIPLLVLHGGPGVPHDYLLTLKELSDQRPVIFYDQLGCGNSGKPSDTTLWTVPRFVEEIVQLRGLLQLEKVHLLGQSWGTLLAVEYLLQEKPAGIQSLTLAAPYLSTSRWIADQQELLAGLPQQVQDTIGRHEQTGDFSDPGYQEAMMVFYREHVCRLDPWPGILRDSMAKIGHNVYTYMWGPSEFTMTGTLKEADVTHRLDEIDLPVMITCGEHDEARPETCREYASALKNAQLHIFEEASHEHHLEKTDDFNKKLRGFLFRTDNAG